MSRTLAICMDSAPHRTLIVFAKEPAAGAVKTRLSRELGERKAAQLYAAFLEDTLAHCRAVRGVELEIAFTPASALDVFAAFAKGARITPQIDGDLGRRMDAAFESAFQRGARQVVIAGSDSPHVGERVIEGAFDALERGPLVLGPCDDGGYFLIGLARREPRLFADVPWSTSAVLETTLRLARELGIDAELLEAQFDVDEPADLARLRALIAAQGPSNCPHTALALADDPSRVVRALRPLQP